MPSSLGKSAVCRTIVQGRAAAARVQGKTTSYLQVLASSLTYSQPSAIRHPTFPSLADRARAPDRAGRRGKFRRRKPAKVCFDRERDLAISPATHMAGCMRDAGYDGNSPRISDMVDQSIFSPATASRFDDQCTEGALSLDQIPGNAKYLSVPGPLEIDQARSSGPCPAS